MLSALWNFGNSTARSSTAFLRGRWFHACNVNHTPSHKDPVKRRELLDRQNAAKRLKRLEDPTKYRNQRRDYHNTHYYGSPENKQKYTERNKRPDVRQQIKEFRQTPAIIKSEPLRKFILRRPHIWRHLEWKTHTPVLYDTKTKHECASCHTKPFQGFALWWKRHDDLDHNPNIYDCHACFVADWSRALPIGYEDFVFGQGKTFRLRDRAESATTATDSKEKG
ncbi:hypothetical protein M436DRAFT_63636 [Aureobasidium namibiae CBS 147.97]|uniref:Uncharacterized protein n=1 Tax=Aureobasidium namibiae CBS 147.97 TaxID=1043004 RepID=A0A074WUA9_9PEZI|nr:uncharacterized protein M436DRAFT_63636 [Aureobasidium namibiae CBS 147.97]KEQ73322.1 hypothetical protein M436DRAFT_63636 [Aureobasidium namibiae CBS 147.97]